MTPLPMTVISGYLGAGKTTLINQILADPQGLRLAVMVNDFGAINIDETLIAAQTDDVIALTNGCVCCTMGADLFMALGDMLDRHPRPDHLIIEASGIADPKAIANAAIAEPDLRYAGIITLVDALNICALLKDPLVAPQVRQQIACADLVLQTKCSARDVAVDAACVAVDLPLPQIMPATAAVVLMLDHPAPLDPGHAAHHPGYTSWSQRVSAPLKYETFITGLNNRPKGLYRLKGWLQTGKGAFEVHVVGAHVDLRPVEGVAETVLVGLGPSAALDEAEMQLWWEGMQTVRDCLP